jgi:GT2 family glycosyltransferase
MLKLATVFYNPSTEDVNYFKKMSNFIDVVAYLNSSHDVDEYSGIMMLGNGTNIGLGAALNMIYSKFDDNCCLLYLDQDSRMSLDDIRILYQNAAIYDLKSTICVPLIVSDKGKSCLFHDFYWRFSWGISSGMLTTCGLVRKLGYFRADYFIDRIDFEFFYRAQKHGVLLQCIKDIKLTQVFGSGENRNRYNKLRHYYQGRNAVLFSLRDSCHPIRGVFFLIIQLAKRLSIAFVKFDTHEIFHYIRGFYAGVKCILPLH